MPKSTEEQIGEHYPTMYMTIVSIVVALVFENLFGLLKDRANLWSLGSALLWVQAAMVVLIGVGFWYHSSLFSASMRRVFSLSDAANPFFVLFVMNALVASIEREHFALFFILFAANMMTGPVVFRVWERLYQEQRSGISLQGIFRPPSLIVIALAVANVSVGLGGWLGIVSAPIAAIAGLGTIAVVIGFFLPAWERSWRKAAGVET